MTANDSFFFFADDAFGNFFAFQWVPSVKDFLRFQ